jgi:hypothetical protein
MFVMARFAPPLVLLEHQRLGRLAQHQNRDLAFHGQIQLGPPYIRHPPDGARAVYNNDGRQQGSAAQANCFRFRQNDQELGTVMIQDDPIISRCPPRVNAFCDRLGGAAKSPWRP